jgi:hypothetical protein
MAHTVLAPTRYPNRHSQPVDVDVDVDVNVDVNVNVNELIIRATIQG